MSHLSASEFIDFSDGILPRERAAHVDGCAACRAQAAAVRDALTLTGASDDVPEPSPLFWDHFSARVRDAIGEPPRRPAFGFRFGALRPIVAAVAVGVVVVSVVFLSRDARTGISSPSAPPVAADGDHAIDPAPHASHAAEWAVLTAAASDLRLDEARQAGMAVPSAAVDRAVTRLTRDELSELGRLLQAELKRAGD
jgi:hypothetical protein